MHGLMNALAYKPLMRSKYYDKLEHSSKNLSRLWDREVKALKQSPMSDCQGTLRNPGEVPAFTWEREDQMQKKYLANTFPQPTEPAAELRPKL
ncbi:hypothetical protein Tco_1438559 [Tanacetum coccineum]